MLVLTTSAFLGILAVLMSALLVFTMQGSPLAQPWAVIAGNTVYALIGIATIHIVGEPLLAMPLAASLSILGMFYCAACTHQPLQFH